MSQKIRILHKINKKKDILNRNVRLLKGMFISMHSILEYWPPFAWITAAMRRGMETISLWHCSGVMEAQVALIAAFRSSGLLGLVSLIFLLKIPHIFSMGFWSGKFAGQSSTVTPWSLNQLLVPLAVWAGANIKLNQHLHKACQQKEAWSALKFPGIWLRWLWTSENTMDQHQQMTWQPKSSLTVETSHWTSSNMDSVPLLSSSRLWDLDFQNKIQNLLSSENRWNIFWRCFCFRIGLVALFLKMSERGDSWCTDSSFSSLLVKLSKCLNQLCLTVFSSLGSSVLLVHIFLPNLFLPVNFAFDMLWYSTPWTATPFSNDPLWLTLFVEGVNDRLLDHCQVSSVPHYCGFKEQEIPWIYTVGMVIYRNSNVNILIFGDTDFWLSLAVSSNLQNEN